MTRSSSQRSSHYSAVLDCLPDLIDEDTRWICHEAIIGLPVMDLGFEHHLTSPRMDFGYGIRSDHLPTAGAGSIAARLARSDAMRRQIPHIYLEHDAGSTVPHCFLRARSLASLAAVRPLLDLIGVGTRDRGVQVELERVMRALPALSGCGFLGYVQRLGQRELRIQFPVATRDLPALSAALSLEELSDVQHPLSAAGVKHLNLQLGVSNDGIQSAGMEIGIRKWTDRPPENWFRLIQMLRGDECMELIRTQCEAWWGSFQQPRHIRWSHLKFSLLPDLSLKHYLWSKAPCHGDA